MKRLPARIVIVSLLLSCCLVAIFALGLGALSLNFGEVIHALFHSDTSQQAALVIHKIRLPRILLALLVGGLLGVCGAIMQSLFRNSLADPSLIGVSAGASVGASMAIVFGSVFVVGHHLTVISLGAFVGGLMAVSVVYSLSAVGGQRSVANMLLVGIAISAVCMAINQLLQLAASNEMLRRMSLWQMGGLDGADYTRVSLAAIVFMAIAGVLPKLVQPLNALLLGESEARHLGINVNALQRLLIVIVAAGVGTSVALAGTIAFVGLIIPHCIRLLLGPDHRYLLIASALGGALLMVLADTLARTAFYPQEIPVGLFTALLGGPFFIWLLRHRHYGAA